MIIRKQMYPVVVLGTALTLTSCIGPGEMQARHAGTCASYGFTPGSEGYAFCMLQLDMADHGYSHHGIGQQPYPPFPSRLYPQPAPAPAPPPESNQVQPQTP